MVPAPSSLSIAPNSFTKYQIDPNLHAPGTLQTAVSVERQLGKFANLAVSYLNTRGFDQLLTRNINAPLSASDPTRPFGDVGNIYQYASAGIFRQNQLITNVNLHAGSKLWLFGYYVLNSAKSDTAGAGSFPSNQYDILADYGRGAFDIRDRLFLGGTIALPHAFRLSPFVVANSGVPYNITLPYDLNGIPFSTTVPVLFLLPHVPQFRSQAACTALLWGVLTVCLMPARKSCQLTMQLVPAGSR